MRLKRDWRYLLNRAWSMKLVILTAVSGTFPLYVSSIPPLWFATLTTLLAVLTGVTRLLDQPSMDRRHEDRPVTPDRRKEE